MTGWLRGGGGLRGLGRVEGALFVLGVDGGGNQRREHFSTDPTPTSSIKLLTFKNKIVSEKRS